MQIKPKKSDGHPTYSCSPSTSLCILGLFIGYPHPKKNTKFLKISKKIVLLCIWAVLLLAVFNYYGLWKYQNEHPTKEYVFASYEDIPEELAIKSSKYMAVRDLIYLNLLLYVIFEFLDYACNPKGHWTNYVIGWWEKHKKHLKEDETE